MTRASPPRRGADALVVSNHGGRQLDGAPSSISVLPSIAEAVGERIEVMFDGGIRSGQDVMKAVALGAKGCMIGKSWLYGLAAGGQAGVTTALEIMRKELDISMALTGTKTIAGITPEILHAPRRGDVLRSGQSRQAAE
ncbi:alpha-hydroxy acid oxidase [Pseudoroseomonas cervicalis]